MLLDETHIRSDSSDCYSLQSEAHSDAETQYQTEEFSLYENQRWWFVQGWAPQMLPDERRSFSDL